MLRKLVGVFIISLSLLSANAQNSETVTQYIKTYCGIAVEEMQRTGVPAAIKLAQGILETTAGQSPLVLKSNNHFGIKCKQGYEGPYVLHDDDRPQERFMKYENADQSYRDHSDFLKGRSRYASLFSLAPTDYKGWAYGLKKAGYATNPRYPQILITLIEKYNLAEYTLMGLGEVAMNEDVKSYLSNRSGIQINVDPTTEKPQVEVPAPIYPEGDFLINYTKVVYAKAGSSLQEIATQYNIPVSRLFDINDFATRAEILQKGTLVYLQLKRTLSEKAEHEVKEGETIYDIAQEEGIRLDALLKYNKLSQSDSPAIGSRLKLNEGGWATHKPATSSNL